MTMTVVSAGGGGGGGGGDRHDCFSLGELTDLLLRTAVAR